MFCGVQTVKNKIIKLTLVLCAVSMWGCNGTNNDLLKKSESVQASQIQTEDDFADISVFVPDNNDEIKKSSTIYTVIDETKDIVSDDSNIKKPDNDVNIRDNSIISENSASEQNQNAQTFGFSDEEDKTDKSEILIEPMKENMYVSASVNVREGPSVDYRKLGTLARDEIVLVTGVSENGWYRISFDSIEGYVNKRFLCDEETHKKNTAETADDGNPEINGDDNNQTGNPEADENINSFIKRVIELCNEQRIAYGLQPLEEDSVLDELAEIRANEIITRFDHVRPDESNCFSVLKGKTEWMTAGENIATGQLTPEEVVDDWMNSEGHRANILSPEFKKIGVGYVTGGEYGTNWVQLFTD